MSGINQQNYEGVTFYFIDGRTVVSKVTLEDLVTYSLECPDDLREGMQKIAENVLRMLEEDPKTKNLAHLFDTERTNQEGFFPTWTISLTDRLELGEKVDIDELRRNTDRH